MEKTIFEKIISREISAHIVYEDEHTIAFLDINPSIKGHTLVVPKKPIKDITECDEETAVQLMKTLIKISRAVKKGCSAPAVNIFNNSGAEAGQVVFHLHFHIIPRYAREEFGHLPHTTYANNDEAEKFRESIKKSIE
ncbi:MAG: HIT family protein [Alphaproteobacteria bacterium]|nr:HIT family protein [Alphaproteobacteria bacterium]